MKDLINALVIQEVRSALRATGAFEIEPGTTDDVSYLDMKSFEKAVVFMAETMSVNEIIADFKRQNGLV